VNLDEYEDALDTAVSAISDLLAFDRLCAARSHVGDEQRSLAAIAASDPGRELARLWREIAGDDAGRMHTAFDRELTDRGLWITTRRAFTVVREHVVRSRRPVPESNAEVDATTITELIALARRGSPAGDAVDALGAEAIALARADRDRALERIDDLHLEAGDDALGVLRASVFDAQVHAAIGEPAFARKLCREVLHYGRGVEGAGRSLEAAALLLGELEATMGHAFRAAQNLDLAAQLARARGGR